MNIIKQRKYVPFARNYSPGTMSWSEGLLGPRGDRGYWMAVDYLKAKNIIREAKKWSSKKNIVEAELGLDGDFLENSSIIFDGKEYLDYVAYPGSQWAPTILIIKYSDGTNEVFECFKKEINT